MIDKQFKFIIGMPRSGSTVLCAILNQHPDVYVTPTSPLLDQLIYNQNAWNDLLKMNHDKKEEYTIQRDNTTRGIINAMWQHRSEKIIIDKCRGWGKNMPIADYLFNEKIKSVVCVRDITEIMASWLSLIRANPVNYLDPVIQNNGLEVNDETRMDEMWNGMVKDCCDTVIEAKKNCENLLFVDYADLTSKREKEVERITKFLDLKNHKYNLNNIINDTSDNDMIAWGFDGLHTIRKSLSKESNDPREILGQKLYDKYHEYDKWFKDSLNGC